MWKRGPRGTGSIYRPKGRRFYLFKTPPDSTGKSRTLATGTADRKEAEAFRRGILQKMERGISTGATKTTMSELATDMIHDYQKNEFTTLDDLIYRLDTYILPIIGTIKVSELSSAHITEFIAGRKAEKATNAEINRQLAVIKRMLNLGIENEKVFRVMKIKMLPELRQRKRGGLWKEKEFRSVMKHLSPWLQPLVEFMWWTGWRLSECQGLKWHNVDFDRRELRLDIGATKNREGEKRLFPFVLGLESLLTKQRKLTKEIERQYGIIVPFVFHRNGNEIRSFGKEWYAACQAAKVAGRKRHNFRNTAAQRLLDLGFTRTEVCSMVGWKTTAMVDYYSLAEASNLHEKAAKLRHK